MRLPNPTKRVDVPVVPIVSDKCNCCPFGYHIDLDFVSFVGDVASGRKTGDSTLQSRRQTPMFTAEELKRSRLSNGHPESASAFQSLSKKSLSDVVNDLNEIAYNPTPINSGSTLTNGTNNLTDGVSTLPPKHVTSKHIEWSPIVPSHDPIQRPNQINGVPRHLPQMPLVDMHAVYSPLDSGYRDHEYREKTPLTVSAELEVQQIFGDNRNRQLPSFRRNVTSAPTSPVQKTYYTAIGQSLAKLTNRTPVSQISRVDPIYNTTTSTPRNPFASTTTPVTSAAKPPLPRRYFDGGRKNRVLSPDPETSSASPNLLRSSNLHSRTYLRPQYADTTTDANSRSIPYRSRLGGIGRGSTGSPLFDSFASVKRSRGLDESRSLSPTGMLETAIYSKVKRFNTNGNQLAVQERSELPTYRPSTVETQTPPYVLSTPVRKLRDSPTQTPPIPTPKVKVVSSVHNESQTNRVYSKNIGVETTARDVNSVALDTVDLKQPIERIPLTFEFQYCIGHEPESQEPIDPRIFKQKELREVGTSTKRPKIVDASTLCRPISMTTQTQTDQIEAPKIVTMENETQTFAVLGSSVNASRKKQNERVWTKKTETEEEEAGEFILITCSKCDRQPVDAAHEQYEKIRVSSLRLSNLMNTQDDGDQLQKSPIRQLQTTTTKSTDSSSDPDEGLELLEPLDFDSDRREEEEHLAVGRISPPTQLRSISPQFDKLKVETSEDTRSLQSNRSDDRSFDDDEREMLANLEQLASFDPDRFSLNTDAQTVICLDANLSDGQRQLDPSRTEAIRKLLTEPNRPGAAFQRESAANRSYRVDKSKAHDLDYILDKHTTTDNKSTAEPSTPDPEKALTEMVVLKKFVSHPSQFPDPVPARIPRPKFTKFASAVSEQAETADEAAEEADKLTPLRSELQYVPSWRGTRRFRHHQYPNFSSDSSVAQPPEDYSDDDEETHPIDPNDPLSSSNSSLTSDLDSNDEDSAVQFEISPPLKEALATLNRHLGENKDDQMHSADWASKYTQQTLLDVAHSGNTVDNISVSMVAIRFVSTWLKITTRKAANAHSIERFIETLENAGTQVLEMVVNTVDNNGNTALHFAASDDNFEAISALLDCNVCRVDETNKAGYSPVMLAALCTIKNETEAAIIQRLFERGNVNAKAVYHGQTALMLACSHGRVETTKLLINCGADVNMQDIDGSTALMCASEHGHKDLVKLLLQQPSIDCSLTDCDDQTALSIAVENGHRDIGILIYAQLNSRGGAT
ncbi:Ankyrin repeat protein [Aphelenchoides besseyi]|nr:Ankyrin repeat protein [Aphelenchoides besseyi]